MRRGWGVGGVEGGGGMVWRLRWRGGSGVGWMEGEVGEGRLKWVVLFMGSFFAV